MYNKSTSGMNYDIRSSFVYNQSRIKALNQEDSFSVSFYYLSLE